MTITFSVDTATSFQEIDGFGGGVNLIEEIPDELADFCFTDQGIALSFCRGERCSTAEGILSNHTVVHANDEDATDFNVPGKDYINIPKLYARGVRTYYSNMWVPREWAYGGQGNPEEYYDKDYPALHPDFYQHWANTWTHFINWMLERDMPVEAVGLQNEPDILPYHWHFIYGVGYSPSSYYNFIVNFLHPAILSSDKPDTEIVVGDFMFQTVLGDYIQPFIDNNKMSMIDRISIHKYFNPPMYSLEATMSQDHTHYGKKVYNTEWAYNHDGAYDPSIQDGLCVGKIIHGHMLRNYSCMGHSTLFQMHWVGVLHGSAPNNSGILGLYDGNNTPIPKRAYVYGQFSRFVRPGSLRVGVVGLDNWSGPVYCTAYKNGTKTVLVVINDSQTDQRVSISGLEDPYYDVWVTDETRSLEGTISLTPNETNVSYIIPKESIVSLVGSDTYNFPDITPPTTNISIPAGRYAKNTLIELTADPDESEPVTIQYRWNP